MKLGTFAYRGSGLYRTTSSPQLEFDIALTHFGKSAFSMQ